MNYPKITIITPSYNQGEYLEETITSVINQQYPNLEYFVVDGGSTDQSVAIIKKFENKISWWVSEKDKGQTDALNKGFKRATGDILCWINSDDYLAPGALQYVASLFNEKKCLVVCGAVTIFDSSKQWNYDPAIQPGESLQIAIGKDYYNQPGTYFHKRTLEEIGMLDERLHYVMDKEWWIRYLLKFGIDNIAVTTQSLAFHRYHDTSKTVSQTDKFMTEYAVILHRICIKAGYHSIAELLEDKYDISKHNYTCDFDVSAFRKEFAVQLIGNLLIRRFDFTINETQYNKGRKLVKTIDRSIYRPDENCAKIYDRLQELTRFPNYLIFRIARKLGKVSNRALYGTGL